MQYAPTAAIEQQARGHLRPSVLWGLVFGGLQAALATQESVRR
jgi:hypothetical protein